VKTNEGPLLAALADPSRRHAFEELTRHGPLSVGQLAERMPISRPALSQHLKILLDAGLVQSTAQGTRRFYGARPEALAMLREWLDLMWRDALNAFAATVDNDNAAQPPATEEHA
jgi:DNA-binding transcriptional ArsR family regulator